MTPPMGLRASMTLARLRTLEARALSSYRLDRKHFLTERDDKRMREVRLLDARLSRARWSALREVMDSADEAVRLVGAA